MLTLATGLWLTVRKGAPISILYFYTSVVLFCVICAVLAHAFRLRRDLADVRKKLSDLQHDNSQLSESIELDELTCARSRRYLYHHLEPKPRSRSHGLLFVDLDHFKSVNDGYGHEIGDALLIEIGKRLVEQCRQGDFVARLGGDEFCIFLEGCDLDQATKAADRFRDAV